MANISGNIINCVFILVAFVIFAGILIRILKNLFSKETELSATVFKKECHTKNVYGKSFAPYVKEVYLVTFLCENKKLTFEVSEFSYNGYNQGQKGILKFKGSRLIDFN